MDSNFHIESIISNGDLYLRPEGDLNGISAWALLNFIHDKYDGQGRIFIDTNSLNRLCSFGCETLRRGLDSDLLPAEHLFFEGEKGFDLAPYGSKIIITHEKHACGGDCKNCRNCACSVDEKKER